MPMVLVIDDEVLLSRELRRYLEGVGYEVRVAHRGEEAMAAASAEPPDLVLLDLRLPDASGLEILDRLREQDPELIVVLMTAYGSVPDAVEAMRRGAADYLQKPLDLDEVGVVLDRLLSRQRQDRELRYLRERARVSPKGVVGDDPRLLAVFEQVARLSSAGLSPGERPSILITGETGTGKGMVAHAIHEILGGGPFVELNCTAIPASLIEAELFGHERGTFTDARSARPGLFEAADGGAIFLDEIGELEPSAQTKFLKVIEEKRVRRLGALRDRPLNVHVIAATQRNLDEAVAQGAFRMDLLHRLRVLAFEIPRFRDRQDDLMPLARHFCAEIGRQYRRGPCDLAPDVEPVLRGYAWPGNVRELRNVLERAILLAQGSRLEAAHLEGLLAAPASGRTVEGRFVLPEAGLELEALERELLRQALERTEGNRTRAAALLGMSRDTLRYRIEKFGLD